MSIVRRFAALVSIMCLFTINAFAQDASAMIATAKDVRLKTDMEAPRNTQAIVTKENPPAKWAIFCMEYEMKAPKGIEKMKEKYPTGVFWSDNVEVTWKMLYKNQGAGKVSYSRYSRTIKYKNVTEGNFCSVVMIDPATLKRNFGSGSDAFAGLKSDFILSASIKVDGITQKEGEIFMDNGVKKAKLDNKAKLDDEKIPKKEDLLILRHQNETPFRGNSADSIPEIVEKN